MYRYMAVKPVTEEVLRKFLDAHGVQLAPGADVTVAASNWLANWTATLASQSSQHVPDSGEAAQRALLLRTASEGLRNNPFKNASGTQ